MPEYKYSPKNYFTLQNILLYIVIGGIVYFVIYYFVFAQKGGSYGTPAYTPPTSTTQETAPGAGATPVMEQTSPQAAPQTPVNVGY